MLIQWSHSKFKIISEELFFKDSHIAFIPSSQIQLSIDCFLCFTISNHLFPYFFNMLSEGENRQIQSRMLHIDEDDDFGILLATAQMDTLGAVTVKPIDNGKD